MENVDGNGGDEIQPNYECPVSSENSACPCYKFEDGELKNFHFFATFIWGARGGKLLCK